MESFSDIFRTKLDFDMQYFIQEKVILNAISKQRVEYSDEELGEVFAKLSSDITTYQNCLFSIYFDIPLMLFRMIASFCVMVYLSWQIACIVLGLQLVAVYIQNKMGKKLVEYSSIVRGNSVGVSEGLCDIIGKLSLIRQIGAENYIISKYKVLFENFKKSIVNNSILSVKINSLVRLILEINVVVILVIGSTLISLGRLQIGALLSLVQYMGRFQNSLCSTIRRIVDMKAQRKNRDVIADEIDKMIRDDCQKKEGILKTDEIRENDCLIDEICIDSVSFSYNENNKILKDASCSFKKGKLNCISGASGSGKSTILSLVMGEYPLDSGKIYLKKKNKLVKLKSQEYIALIPQDNKFFTDTIFNNLDLGNNNSYDKIVEVCKWCSIYDEIMSAPNGFNTILSSGMDNFSGGQKKRLAIARAILQDKSVVLADEPTTGLDAENASKVIECLRRYANNKLMVIVTHDKKILNLSNNHYEIKNKKLVVDSYMNN